MSFVSGNWKNTGATAEFPLIFIQLLLYYEHFFHEREKNLITVLEDSLAMYIPGSFPENDMR
jgi:hypothetical protein